MSSSFGCVSSAAPKASRGPRVQGGSAAEEFAARSDDDQSGLRDGRGAVDDRPTGRGAALAGEGAWEHRAPIPQAISWKKTYNTCKLKIT